jgi:hypothetical protein
MSFNNFPVSDYPTPNSLPTQTAYTNNQVFYIRALYVLGILAWLFVIYVLSILNYDWFIVLLAIIPIIMFVWTWYIIPTFIREYEDSVFQVNYLSITMLVVIPLFFNLSKLKHDNCALRIVIIGVFFVVLSVIDVWTHPDNISIIKHFKSIVETFGIFLLLIAIYIYFQELFYGSSCENSKCS